MLAKDIMTKHVVSARLDSTIVELVDLMLKHHISALPIENTDGDLVGLVSEGDLIRRSEIGAREYSSWWLAAIGGKLRLAEDFIKTHGMRAEEIMTKNVVSVSEDTPVWQIAEVLEKNSIKRTPVLRDGSVVGIVSRANLLQALAKKRSESTKEPSEDDKKIRAHILDTLDKQAWSDTSRLNVIVSNGVVHYWGQVKSDTERRALKAAAEILPEVKEVRDHTQKSIIII
ncbi:MAG: CBS domain-containing protein [Methyloligellaceae bacterium]